jgi:hypothetical protein
MSHYVPHVMLTGSTLRPPLSESQTPDTRFRHVARDQTLVDFALAAEPARHN